MVNLLLIAFLNIEMAEGSLTEQELSDQGWKLASSTSGQHLQRTLEMYRELGIETYLYKVDPVNCGDCTMCFTGEGETLFRIYIKPAN
jgi:hypothetical protein